MTPCIQKEITTHCHGRLQNINEQAVAISEKLDILAISITTVKTFILCISSHIPLEEVFPKK